MAVQIPTRRPQAAMRSMKPFLDDELCKLHEDQTDVSREDHQLKPCVTTLAVRPRFIAKCALG
jgi:hypothetical protein